MELLKSQGLRSSFILGWKYFRIDEVDYRKTEWSYLFNRTVCGKMILFYRWYFEIIS
jgi:hypothetical protein